MQIHGNMIDPKMAALSFYVNFCGGFADVRFVARDLPM